MTKQKDKTKEGKIRELKIGDVVKLKSGSPNMTLYLITDNGNYWCRYYQDEKWLERAFNECELKLI